jgi:hypothetical protein
MLRTEEGQTGRYLCLNDHIKLANVPSVPPQVCPSPETNRTLIAKDNLVRAGVDGAPCIHFALSILECSCSTIYGDAILCNWPRRIPRGLPSSSTQLYNTDFVAPSTPDRTTHLLLPEHRSFCRSLICRIATMAVHQQIAGKSALRTLSALPSFPSTESGLAMVSGVVWMTGPSFIGTIQCVG